MLPSASSKQCDSPAGVISPLLRDTRDFAFGSSPRTGSGPFHLTMTPRSGRSPAFVTAVIVPLHLRIERTFPKVAKMSLAPLQTPH